MIRNLDSSQVVSVSQDTDLNAALQVNIASADLSPSSTATSLTELQILNPGLGRMIGNVNPAPDGVTRDKLSVPVATSPHPDDTTLFESPSDASQKFYLPRYRIVDRPPLQLSLAQGAQDWTLTIELEKYAAPGIGPGASELPHKASVLIRYNLLSGGVVAGVKELSLTEVTVEPNGIKAVLRGQQTALRDQIFLAMTDTTYSPALVVRRVAAVAVPIPAPEDSGLLSTGQGTLRGTWMFSFDTGSETGNAGADVWWDQISQTERQLQPQGTARIVNLGMVDFNSLDLDQLRAGSYATSPIPANTDGSNQLVPGDVFAVETNLGNYAKVQVVSYGYDLALRWATYKPATGGRRILFDHTQVLVAPILTPPVDPMSGDGSSVVSPPVDATQSQQSLNADQATVAGAPGPVLGSAARVAPEVSTTSSSLSPTVAQIRQVPIETDTSGSSIFIRPWPFPPPLPPPPPPPAPPVSLYRLTVYSDDEHVEPDPLVFAPTSYVFVNLGQVGGALGLERNDVGFNGSSFSYYRDLAEPWIYYYLPDKFKLARRDQSPHFPAMSVQMRATDDTLEHTSVTLTYTAMPFVDPTRIAAASAHFATKLPLASLPQGVTGPDLQALQVDEKSASYKLSLPTLDGAGGFLPRDKAIVDLRGGIIDSITVSLSDFQAIYSALLSDTDLFRGVVEVRLGPSAIYTEHVELVGRISDMCGAPPLNASQSPDIASGGLVVVLTNAIESPLQISNLTAQLTRDGLAYPATIQGLDLSTPRQLQPGDAVTLTVVPLTAPVPGSGALQALVDTTGVTVQVNPGKVWDSILDARTPNQYEHKITVQVFKSAFDPPASSPTDPVQEIKVDFQPPATVEVRPAQLPAPAAGPTPPEPMVEVSVALHLAISDYILNTPQYDTYEYKITRIFTSAPAAAGDWTTVSHSDSIQIQGPPS